MDTPGKQGILNEAYEEDLADTDACDKSKLTITGNTEDDETNSHNGRNNSNFIGKVSTNDKRNLDNLKENKKKLSSSLRYIEEDESKIEEVEDAAVRRYTGSFRSFREEKAKKSWGRGSLGEELRRKQSTPELNRSQYSLISCTELTPGAVQLWKELPEEVKYDPALEQFRQLYEKEYGPSLPSKDEGKKKGNSGRLPTVSSAPQFNNKLASDDVLLKMDGDQPLSKKEIMLAEQAEKKQNRSTVAEAGHLVKMTVLLACWVYFTLVFLLYNEKELEELGTFVNPGELKHHLLLDGTKKLLLNLKVTGPFLSGNAQEHLNDTQLFVSTKLDIWLEAQPKNGSWYAEVFNCFPVSWIVCPTPLVSYVQLRIMFRDTNKMRICVPRNIQDLRNQISIWKRAAESLPHLSKDVHIVKERLERKVQKLSLKLEIMEKEAKKRACPKETFQSTLVEMKDKYKIRDQKLLIKSTVAISFVVTLFFLHSLPQLHVSLGWCALLGAILLLILADREDLEPILHRVEWSTLLFFAALFVLMEVLSKLGLIEYIGILTESLILTVDEGARLAVALLLILWVSGVTSAFVDNIPLTTMMVRVVTSLGSNPRLNLPMMPLIWALSFGACLGGNGTLIGASANVVCAGVAEQHGYKFTFNKFFKIGFPIMIGHLIVVSAYLLVCHCVFTWH